MANVVIPWEMMEEIGKLINMLDAADVSDEIRQQVEKVWKFVEAKVEKERSRNEYIKKKGF
jgi:dissimilatory sulfite reductase (desulfoviridin) alpha/beta subunit